MTEVERGHREQLRSDCYRLLGEGFFAPEPERFLREELGLALADALRAVHPDTEAAAHAAAFHEALWASSAVELSVDHAALFVGPFALKAPPYGSVYLEEGRTLMGDTTLAAQARYADTGLTVAVSEPPDHITVELEFMHYLAGREAQALARGDEATAASLAGAQRQFLAEHLGAWAPAFCADVALGAQTAFYRALADCLLSFLAAEMGGSAAVVGVAG